MKKTAIILIALSFFAGSCKSKQNNITEILPEELTQMPFAVRQPLNHMAYCGSDSLYHYFFHSKFKEGREYKVLREKLFFADEFPYKEYRKNGDNRMVLFFVYFDEEENVWRGKFLK